MLIFNQIFPVARQQPFVLGVYSDTTTAQPGTGFSLDYTQVSVTISRAGNTFYIPSFHAETKETNTTLSVTGPLTLQLIGTWTKDKHY